ncbi:FAD-binding oxidoreductase [Bacillus sp. FJAT-50079]|uniref:NAD(P)/FAD-dependent oxidoreductase n=1 Tax=Bacillus sp. FJAT-50079 TaxID=2833577 RepID=UPI001BC9AF4C|nr:FAD-binding oxidoreductase [Bacillus sp. FJAT-50079]MBS4207034.1 FAD-binding oxidoreductase [Bacillus sp. FJAT-50079]
MKRYIVIGAGILGASTAYHLAKSGKAEVTIIDRQDPGQATDAAAGIICPWLTKRRNKAWYALAKGGAAYYPTLINQLEEDGERETGYEKVGAIRLHTDDEKLIELEELALKKREEAPEMGTIEKRTEAETKALFPPLSAEYQSLFVQGGARVNGRALRQSLINGAKKHGARFIQGSAQLMFTSDHAMGILVGDKQYRADHIIVTAGAWAAELLSPLGIELQVSGQKAQIAHLQLEGEKTEMWPVVMPPNNQYILSFADGRIVVGATHEDDTNFDRRVTVGGLHEVFDKALTVAPGLADATFVEARVGFRPVTPNFLPIIGQVPGYKGLYLANGLGASGLTVGPYLGMQLAKLTLGEEVDIDLDKYDINGAIE